MESALFEKLEQGACLECYPKRVALVTALLVRFRSLQSPSHLGPVEEVSLPEHA
jgi:hypothetical protein